MPDHPTFKTLPAKSPDLFAEEEADHLLKEKVIFGLSYTLHLVILYSNMKMSIGERVKRLLIVFNDELANSSLMRKLWFLEHLIQLDGFLDSILTVR